MRHTAWIGVAGAMLCVATTAVAGDCCPTVAKAAAETAEAETKVEAKAEAKTTLCGAAGDCQLDGALAKLDLTEEQKGKIAAIAKETGCDRKPAEGACPKGLQAKRKACMDKVMAVLTEEQKAQVAKLCPKGKCPKKDAPAPSP